MGSTRVFSNLPDPNIAQLQASIAALADSDIPGVMLHPTLIYGAEDENSLKRIAVYIRRLGVIPLPDGGKVMLQPIHVEDVAACIDAALQRDEAVGEPIVIAGPDRISYRELVLAIGSAIGRQPLILPVPGMLLEVAALLTSALPFLPRIRRDEVRRLTEDKTFPIDDMIRRLAVTPMPLAEGLRRTFSHL